MAIVLTAREQVGAIIKAGQDDTTLGAGTRLRIESSPDGVEYLDVVVPPGKQWNVRMGVTITETTV